MIGPMLALALAVLPPTHLQVSNSRGTVSIPLVQQRGDGPLLSLNALARALGATVEHDDTWVTLSTSAGRFRFLAGTPLVQDGIGWRGMPGASRRRGDSLYVPLAFVADVLADSARRAWNWTAATAVLREGAGAALISMPLSRTTVGNDQRSRLPGGLRAGHHVTIDPGHGGPDVGAPGVFFPQGMHEKDVTLAVGLLVAAELERKGVRVTMTRSRDTLINLGQRAPRYCQADCDLFVSIHANSLERRPGYTQVRGFETYFLSEARSADAERVARMENGAVRYDTPLTEAERSNGLDFMFKDLQRAEFLRESQRAASLIQSMLEEVHDGPNHGVKQAGFAVLNTARRPSVLIEMGYSTNRDDAELMTTPRGQRDLAAAIARAIVEYLRHYDQETADTSGGWSQ